MALIQEIWESTSREILTVTTHEKDFPSGSAVEESLRNARDAQKIWVRFLGREDPLQKEMAPQSSILAWEIPWTEESGGLQSTGLQKCWTQLSN